jgi:serine/threonine protein kinase
MDCVDRRIYDLKVYELDTFMRFRGHPNIISLFSYWAEKPSSPYQYKSLVCLFEEALLGDMLKTVVLNPVRPTNRLAMKYLCDICKGLASLNNCNIIHGSVKPSSIYIQSDNTAMIGELGKVELDSARHTHQLFSKVLI